MFADAMKELQSSNADVLTGGRRYEEAPFNTGNFVQPTLAIPKSVDPKSSIWSTETFAPILNVAIFDELEQAIEWTTPFPR